MKPPHPLNLTLLALASPLILVGLSTGARAHSSYLSMEGRCISCHASPFGGGPLNDRGRRLNATVLASRDMYDDDIPNRNLEKHAGFWFTQAFIPGIRPDLSTSLSHQQTAVAESRNHSSTGLEDVQASLTLLPYFDERLTFTGTLKYTPPPSYTNDHYNEKYSSWDLPQHYVQWHFFDRHILLLGMTDKFFGAQLSDMDSYARVLNQNGTNDQVHQLSWIYQSTLLTGSLQLHLGDLFQEKKYREKGAVARAEWRLSNKLWGGWSAAFSRSDARDRILGGPHFRFGGEDRAFLGQATANWVSPTGIGNKELLITATSEGSLRVQQGLWVLTQFEFFKGNIFGSSQEGWRIGPGLWWSPINRLKLESSLRVGRSLTRGRGREEDISLIVRLKAFL